MAGRVRSARSDLAEERTRGVRWSGEAVVSESDGSRQVDLAAVRERYRLERDQRLRPERNAQYRGAEGEFGHLAADPHSPYVEREAVADEVDAVIVGAGIGGLYAAGRLKEAGLSRVRLIEQAGDVGGVWYWNRYPGAQCDVESHIYLPLLEETGYHPRERYAKQPEILRYCQFLAEHYELYPFALFQTEVVEAFWDATADRWVVSTNRGDVVRSRYIVISNGMLSRPQLPRVPGANDFAGKIFHTSRWDYEFTGGSPTEGLSALGDKRVGVIGTGATAIQCIPELAKAASQLFVFQRTPSAIWPRENRATPPDWASQRSPGWQAARMWNFDQLFEGHPVDEDLVGDSWTALFHALHAEEDAELADYLEMERVRARVDGVVSDPETAQKLKPYFRAGCKRPGFSDNYLEVFNRPNVELVDVHPIGVEAITEAGIMAHGQEYSLDCIIFATGVQAGTAYTHQIGAELIGRNGTRLSDAWGAGIRTFQGIAAHGFPNCFFLGLTQTAGANNYIHIVHHQIAQMLSFLDHQWRLGAPAVEPTSWAVDQWQIEMKVGSEQKLAFWNECIPSRLNDSGNLDFAHSRIAGHFGRGAIACWREMEAWRASGSAHGLEFTKQGEVLGWGEAISATPLL